MKKPNEKFDHRKHKDLLESASNILYSLGHEKEAGAVMRAKMLHSDMESRIGNGRTALRKLVMAQERIRQAQDELKAYTLQARPPWIGDDIFPLDPDANDVAH